VWGDGELTGPWWGLGAVGNSPAPTTDREWELGAMGRWGVNN